MKKMYAHFATAFSFLTRLPLPGLSTQTYSQETLSASMAWYPLVGLSFGLPAVAMVWLGSLLQLDPTLTAFGVLLLPYLLNRFLHFDGLCDVLDGFLADRPAVERLAIMKDSRNGSFAMGGAILFLLGKYLVLLNLLETGFSAMLVVLLAPVLARWILVPMAYKAHYPRERGTALALVGRIPRRVLMVSSGQCALIVGLAWVVNGMIERQELFLTLNQHGVHLGLAIGLAILAIILWMLAFRGLARHKIGGVTGDVLGCLCESSELLFVAVSFLVIHLAS